MATLSVCTFTHEPLVAVARSLTSFREVADEIVAVVDEGADLVGLDQLEAVCDRIVVTAFQWPLEANLAWLENQCSGEWVLRIDGDEVPSTALIDRLADQSWTDGVTHVHIARRWLWGDHTTMLDQSPWWLDPQCRLVRRGVAEWPEGKATPHSQARISGASRLLVEPLYHLNLLVTDAASRLARARRYEAASAEMVTADGVSQNIGFYLPEARGSTLRITQVPAIDRPMLKHAVEAFGATSHPDETPSPLRTKAIVENRADPPIVYGGVTIEAVTTPPANPVEGSTTSCAVHVTNRSGFTWHDGDRSPVVVGARIIDEQGRTVAREARTRLPRTVPSGGSETVDLSIGPLPCPGRYHLSIGALREGVAWYEPTLTIPIDVTRRMEVLVSSGISPTPHLGDDLIVDTVLDAFAHHALGLRVILVADDPEGTTRRFGAASISGAGALLSGMPSIAETARRLFAWRRDAKAFAQGRAPKSQTHAELLSAIAEADCLIVLGAGWMASRYRRSGIAPRLFEVEAARLLGCPVIFEAGSVGPFTNTIDRLAARRILGGSDHITVRDRESARSVRQLGIFRHQPAVVPDIATAYPVSAMPQEKDRWLENLGVDPGAPYAVLSARGDQGGIDGVFASAAAELDELGVTTVFLPHYLGPGGNDVVRGRLLSARTRLRVPDEVPPNPLAATIVRDAKVAFGNRLHLLILAARNDVPGVFVATDGYDRRRGHTLSGSSVQVVGPQEAKHAVRQALVARPGAPEPTWNAAQFISNVPLSAHTRPRRAAMPEQPPVRVGSPRRSNLGHRIQVRVDGVDVTVTCDDFSLDAPPEAFPTAFAFPTAAAGRAMVAPGPLDRSWRVGLERNIAFAHDWWQGPDNLELKVRLGSPLRSIRPTGPIQQGIAVCFTGGVDSFYTLLTMSPRPSHLVFVIGFDVDATDEERIRWVRETLDDVADATGIVPIVVSTDLRRHPTFNSLTWELTHGSALAAIGHLLHHTIGTLVIPPSFARHRLRPWGSHPRLDSNWSVARRLRIVHGDHSLGRLERLGAIANEPLVQRNLRVCWQNVPGSRNCGHCEKCVRTMVVLAGIGRLDDVTTFPSRCDLPERLDAIEALPPHLVPVWHDLAPQGLSPEERRALSNLFDRSRPARHRGGVQADHAG